ncbi:Hypothetical predicted protein [Pelobates cultripes]|uniref:Uncharacterized protein n=1 Tax=Pelobates cultripes TaxID=61616 RepID=A0AAD1RYF2_PELCU|nr:Hypothetical predicted protein [Pelobates cultripes]
MSVNIERMDEHCLANNEIVKKKMEHDHKCLTENLADLEDHSYRNNNRTRRVSESVTNEEPPEYLKQLFHTIQPNLENVDLRLDRAHWVPKPKNLAQDVQKKKKIYYT